MDDASFESAIPKIHYNEPNVRHPKQLVEVDVFGLMKCGDLLVRRSDGEIVPIVAVSFLDGNGDTMGVCEWPDKTIVVHNNIGEILKVANLPASPEGEQPGEESDETDIVCPQCGYHFLVLVDDYDEINEDDEACLMRYCPECGYVEID